MVSELPGWEGYEDLLEQPRERVEAPLLSPDLYKDGRMIEALAPVDFNGRWVYEGVVQNS